MLSSFKLTFVGLIGFGAAFVGLIAASHAVWSADISIQHAWALPTPRKATVGRAFLTIVNTSTQTDHLLSATVEVEVAHSAQITGIRISDNAPHTRQLANLDIPPASSLEFKPGAYHVMLINLKKPLAAGDAFKGTLTFQGAGVIPVEYTVEKEDKMVP
jgi:copper(I)-binding protein